MAIEAHILNWKFLRNADVPKDVDNILTQGEKVHFAYKTLRDSALFTNKRLIVRDAQGLTGKKVEIYSLPYSSILMWSSENRGMLDLDAEIELWTKVGRIKISIGKQVNIREIDSLLSAYVLD